MNEVTTMNTRHEVKKQLLDRGLHGFVLSMLSLASDSYFLEKCPTEMKMSQKIFEFCVKFFLNIVLHCRERKEVKRWLTEFKRVFSYRQNNIANLFLEMIVSQSTADEDWFNIFLLSSIDSSARKTFVSLLISATLICIPPELEDDLTLLGDCLLLKLLDKVKTAVMTISQYNSQCCRELFILVRELAVKPCVRKVHFLLIYYEISMYYVIYY